MKTLPKFHDGLLDRFPELKTPRLLLREVSEPDTATVFQLYSDERIMRYRGAAVFTSEQQAHELIRTWAVRLTEKSGIRWGIVLKENNRLIGTAGFHSFTKEHFRGEIGYELSPGHWNNGLMTEALREITGWGLRELGLHSIEANIAPENHASKRVLEKLGFTKEAHFRENYYYRGWWDSVIYSLRETS